MATINGNNRGNRLVGTASADLINGNGGDDVLEGGGGSDTLNGGTGNDRLQGGSGNDIHDGGSGTDLLDFSDATAGITVTLTQSSTPTTVDLTLAELGTDTYRNMEGVVGSSFDDSITGSGQSDVLLGGAGNDTILGGAGNDFLDGGVGNDALDGGIGNDTLLGGGGNDVLTGGEGLDFLDGGSGNDALDGGSGNDVLLGGSGNDTLIGGTGADLLTGGTGSDTFAFSADASTSDSTNTARDTIFDFQRGSDKIDLTALLGASNLAWGGTTPTANGVWYQISGFSTLIFADVTGNSTPELAIRLVGRYTLTQSDFLGVGTASNNTPPNSNATAAAGNEDAAIVVNLSGSDADGTVVSFRVSSLPTSGTLFLADGVTAVNTSSVIPAIGNTASLIFRPNANFSGSASFQYTAVDNAGATDATPATATITVNPVNDAPLAANDSTSTSENTAVTTGNVLVNDTDVDNTLTPASITAFTQAANGSVVNNGNGTFTYTPNTGFSGNDSFTYTVTDAGGLSSTATVTVSVGAVNDAPTANSGTASGNEDTSISGSVTANDPESDPLTYSTVTGPANGTLVLNPNGSYTYTPNANFNGADSFTFKANDGALDSNVATINITVNPVNDAPVAANDSTSTSENTAVTTGNVLVNDTDVDNTLTPASITAFTQAANGSVVNNGNGTFTYTPNTGFSGNDSFTYTVTDAGGLSSTATVTISVGAVNDAPVANGGTASGNEDTGISGSVTANDPESDPLTYSTVTGPANGTLVLNPNGSYTYTPNANFNGSDSFTFKANDGALDSNVATINITVDPVNDAPTANSGTASGNEDTSISGSVTANDPESDPLTYSTVTGPANGTLVLNPNGSYTYTPNANFNGADSFTFKANDGALDSNVATINITVNPVNDAPVAANDSASTNENTPVTTGNVLVNDTDVDNTLTPASITAFTQAANGSVVNNGNGTFTYTPNAGFSGNDSFTYTVTDAGGLSSTATVTVSVGAVNDAPTANSGTASGNEDTSISGSVTANDPESDPLTYSTVTGPANGTLVLNPNGSYTYTPNANFNGSDSFTFKANDGALDSNVATINITVNPVNDAPVAVDDSALATVGTVIGTGAIALASSDTVWNEGNGRSINASFSADGKKVIFQSAATDLVPGGDANNAADDLFIKDLTTGSITRISVNGAIQANGASGTASFSADGSKIVFESSANNLVSGDTNLSTDIFVKDLASGVITLVSTDGNGALADSSSSDAVFSPDGSKVAFVSNATNLVTGDTNARRDIFVKDLATGVITLVSSSIGGTLGNGNSAKPVFSPDGTKIAFVSDANNLASGDTNTASDIYIKDLVTGAVTLASTDAAGNATTSGASLNPVFSPDGTRIMFESGAANLVGGDSNAASDIFIKNLITGVVTRVSTDSSGGQVNGTSTDAVFSADGTKVAFVSTASNLVTGDTNATADVFVKDLITGAVTRVSTDANGVQGNNAIGGSSNPMFSPDGTLVVFQSGANNLVPGDGNGLGVSDIFVKQLVASPGASGSVLANDTDIDSSAGSLIVSSVRTGGIEGGGAAGAVGSATSSVYGSLILNANGDYTYTVDVNSAAFRSLNTGDTVTDQFNYTVSDGAGGTDTAVLNITIAGVNDAPVAVGDSITTTENTPNTTNYVLGNDTDPDNPLSIANITAFTQGANGSVVNNGNGTFTYTPNAGFSGNDSFTYTVTDAGGLSSTATVTVSVGAVNDAPVANSGTASGNEDTGISGSVTANDPEGDPLTYSTVTGPANGTLVLNPNGSYTYTPNANFNGTDSFTFKANDGALDSNVATINITVNPVNDAPVAANDSASTSQNTAVTVGVLGNDTDVDNVLTGASVTAFTQGANGSVLNNLNGTLTYTPNAGFSGSDSFTYTVLDAGGLSSTATVTVQVGATITGTVNNDALNGSAGNDTLIGGAGDDTYRGGPGNDVMNDSDAALGVGGNDTYIYNLGDGNDEIIGSSQTVSDDDTLLFGPGVSATDISLVRIVNQTVQIDLSAALGGGQIRLTNQTNFFGSAMNIEKIRFSDGTIIDLATWDYVTVGTVNNDILIGVNTGGGINDTIKALAGNDSVNGGGGNDFIDPGPGSDNVLAGSGDDWVIHTLSENNVGTEVDRYTGGSGTDTLVLRLTAAEYTDPAILSDIAAYTAFLSANANPALTSGPLFQFSSFGLTVNSFENLVGEVTGTNGSDTITGGSEANVIIGGTGADSITGGSGSDTFDYGLFSDWANGDAGNRDVITDFVGNTSVLANATSAASINGDVLRVDHAVLSGLAGFVAGSFVAPTADHYSTLGAGDLVIGTAATAAHAQFLYDSGTGIVSFDPDGTGAQAAIEVTQLGATTHPTSLSATAIVVQG